MNCDYSRVYQNVAKLPPHGTVCVDNFVINYYAVEDLLKNWELIMEKECRGCFLVTDCDIFENALVTIVRDEKLRNFLIKSVYDCTKYSQHLNMNFNQNIAKLP